MKKIIASITVLCYLAVTCGIVVNTHYCMNEISSVHFFETHTEKCDKCGMDIHQSNGCCKDELSFVKLVQDQNKIQAVNYDITAPDLFVINTSVYFISTLADVAINSTHKLYPPPLLSGQDTYLLNNVFRI